VDCPSEESELKVIDFHVHIGRKEHWKEWVHAYQKASGSEFYDRYQEMTDPEKFGLYLKRENIERAVILPEISPITTGVVSNEYVLEFCQGRGIFIPFCTINPSLVGNPGREFKKYINMGAKGLKLYPSYNYFYPNDRELYPIYDVAEELQLPVLVHTGSSIFRGSKIKYAEPIHLDDVATDFPDLILLMAHSGRGFWYDQAFFLSRIHPNLYLEISGLPPKNLLTYFPEMERNIDKFVYGSDWPGIKSIGSNIDLLEKLPLSRGSIEKLLYGNAARILKLQ
jgi:hypothetical protein